MIAVFREQHPTASVAFLCRLGRIGRSWWYEKQASPSPSEECQEANRNACALRDAIEQITLEFPGYGYRRVAAQLVRDGWTGGDAVNHKRVLRVMHEESLLCRLKKRFVATTDSVHQHRTYPNLLKGLALCRPDQAWVADLTYIRLPTGFCYLATVLDAFSRRCVGWHLSREIDTRLTLAALERALSQRQPAEGLIHHSDRGVQYASADYVNRLEQAVIRPSMSAKGNPYDNAKAESFFKTLKTEEVYLRDYQNYSEACTDIAAFIDAIYNQKRLHSSLGYRPPVEFETDFYNSQSSQKINHLPNRLP